MAKRIGAQPHQAMRKRVYANHGRRCAYCGTDSEPITIDHIIPFSICRSSKYDNLVPACQRCNLEKGDMLPLDFIVHRIRLESVLRRRSRTGPNAGLAIWTKRKSN